MTPFNLSWKIAQFAFWMVIFFAVIPGTLYVGGLYTIAAYAQRKEARNVAQTAPGTITGLQPIDYDALAKENGGTITGLQPLDNDASASTQPSSKIVWDAKPDVSGLVPHRLRKSDALDRVLDEAEVEYCADTKIQAFCAKSGTCTEGADWHKLPQSETFHRQCMASAQH